MDENRLQSYLNVINQLLICDRGQEPEILRQNQDLIDSGLVQAMEQVAGVLVKREAFQQAEWLRQLASQLDSALPTPPLLDQKDKVAYRRVRSFEERFGKAHLYLAYHGAFPLALTPDLLYKIWANFHRDIEDRLLNIPWEAVADVLLSGLCKEVGGEELYEMDLAVRNVLLGELKENPWFGAKRIEELSEFLLGYVGQQICSDDPDIKDFARVQKWTALAYIKPDKAARELALALREKLQEQNKAELVRMASVVDTLAEPLAGFEPLLVYSRGMGKLARGDSEGAFVQFRELGETEDWVRVKGISLPVPGEGGADGSRAIGDLAKRLKRRAISEQRKQAYFNLIQSLLNCPTGEEAEMLRTNANLVDTGLMETMKQVAAALAERGEQSAANFVRRLASQIADALGMSRELIENSSVKTSRSIKAKADDYMNFLFGIWQIISDTSGNLQEVVYPILKANIDKLNDSFLYEILKSRGMALLSLLEPEEARGIAAMIGEFSDLIQEFPLGDRANKLEIAITGYELASTRFAREVFPKQWASLQNSVGVVYLNRIRGERAENIERAIAAYEAALTVYTREAFPTDWATAQNNIGAAYRNRIRGEKAENIERAIACYSAALSVYTREAFPVEWAARQNNLGIAYSDKIRGDRANNLENAIACYGAALEVYTREAFPVNWAATQNNLGLAYSNRIGGDKAENLEKAIACYSDALTVYTREAFPVEWARTQNNLGAAYSDTIRGDRALNLENAIACYSDALTVYTRDAFPVEWATTRNNLGHAYNNRIRGDRAENIEGALDCFRVALEIFTPTNFPIDCLKTSRNLGNTAFTVGWWQEAIAGYHLAIEAVETSRNRASSNSRRQEILAESISIYEKIVQACINNGQSDKAIEYVERSKARTVLELLATRDLYPKGDIPEIILNELDRLRREIVAEELRLDILENNFSRVDKQEQQVDSVAYRPYLNQLRQQLEELIARDIQPIDPIFSLTQKVAPISFSEIQRLLPDERAVILEWYITSERFFTFIITRHSQAPIVWQSSSEDLEALVDWINEYIKTYYERIPEWKAGLKDSFHRLSNILHLEGIVSLIPDFCNQLILIPYRFLQILPLDAIAISPDNNLCLLDRFKGGVYYAPSSQILQQVQCRERSSHFNQLLAIQNPNNDLSYADIEVGTIVQYFERAEILVKKSATKEAINKKNLSNFHCLHFSGHSSFNLSSPLESALILADGKLILAEIFAFDLSQCRLVTLSASETVWTDFSSISDEYIGFDGAFLVAGAASVVGSLWSDYPFSTCCLMIKFYENMQTQSNLAIALNQAQLWLRDITKIELKAWIEEKEQHLKLNPRLKISWRRRLAKMLDNSQPFREPYYWAAFAISGAVEWPVVRLTEWMNGTVDPTWQSPEEIFGDDDSSGLEFR